MDKSIRDTRSADANTSSSTATPADAVAPASEGAPRLSDATRPAGSESRPMIELRRLHRSFGATNAVNDVSFEVFPGQVLGFIGPNGAGKTTSMRILATLDLPTYGDAFVNGFSVVFDPDRVRRRLGFMPDYFGTYASMDCYEYLDFFARAYGLIGRDRHRAIKKVMGFTGLDKLRYKPTNGLSKGMKQRLCLGRAMVHDPAVLILDEPAAGLDPRARIELRTMIRELAAGGKALLVSSHILTELAEICDRVGIIEKGRLLAQGTVEEIQERANSVEQSALGALADGDTRFVELQLRVLHPNDEIATWLSQRELVTNVVPDGRLVRFSFKGDKQRQMMLLRDLIAAEFEISDFTARSKSLEDVFMHVTKGVVQ